MRGVLVLFVLSLLMFHVAVAQNCIGIHENCDYCLENGCFFCSLVGCRENTTEERNSCVNETDSVAYDYCPGTNGDCLPSNSSCSDCRIPPRNCYLDHIVGFEDNQFCSFEGLGVEICHITDDSIQNSIQSTLSTALKYYVEKSPYMSFTLNLTRNQLHVVNTYDICGSHPMTGLDGYYPDMIFVRVNFHLDYPIASLAERDYVITSAVNSLAMTPDPQQPNTTQIGFEFITGCNKAAPVNPIVYVLNRDGMLVVAVQAMDLQYKMVAHQFQPLDDHVVLFDMQLLTAAAGKMYISTLLLMAVIVIMNF